MKFGAIFNEQISAGKKLRGTLPVDKSESGQNLKRPLFFIAIFIFGMGILLARLFSLTILEGSRLRKLASENRIREEKITAPRGIIYDRNGVALVRNIPVFSDLVGNIFYEDKPATPGAQLVESIGREYIIGDSASHVIGFIGQTSQKELEKGEHKLGDLVGKLGIEQSYDSILAGVDGKRLFEVDAIGTKARVLGQVNPKPGENIHLSVDSNLQRVARSQLQGNKGAVIATNPYTGEVLALFSSPSFDPNKLIRGQDLETTFSNPDEPFFNRAISGQYPPGSVFKIITAIAALESRAINKDTKIEDVGILQVGKFSFGNWYFNQYGKKEGYLDIVGALRRSNDIFFYKTGELTGIETLAGWARKLGVSRISGIDISGEEMGVMPDPAWIKEMKREDWFLGNTYHVAIGQGDLLTTPLQVNSWTNVIANGGKLCKPHLALDSSTLKDPCIDLAVKKETLDLVREGMKQACSPGGTGWPLFNFKVKNEKLKIDGMDFLDSPKSTQSGKFVVEIPVACKTGTAEFGDPKGRSHAWFTVFAPVYNPQISVTVIVEGGGEGSSVAAPIAKKILEEWFSR